MEMTKEERQELARTILRQLGGGMGKLKMMVGASYFMLHENGVQFKFKMYPKANTIVIKLNGSDLYDIEYWKITPKQCKKVHEFNDYYADMLRDNFEETTGLTLTPPRFV